MGRLRVGPRPLSKLLSRSVYWKPWLSMRRTTSHGRPPSHWRCRVAAILTPTGIFRQRNLRFATNSLQNLPISIAPMLTFERTDRRWLERQKNAKQWTHRHSNQSGKNSIRRPNKNRIWFGRFSKQHHDPLNEGHSARSTPVESPQSPRVLKGQSRSPTHCRSVIAVFEDCSGPTPLAWF
jgi:hypothetical protein